MDMIERVARAIEPDIFADRERVAAEAPEYLPTYSGQRRIGAAYAKARAAIEALREPSEAMLGEGWANSPSDWCDSPNLYENGQEALAYVYRAMIDAALAESQAPGGVGE